MGTAYCGQSLPLEGVQSLFVECRKEKQLLTKADLFHEGLLPPEMPSSRSSFFDWLRTGGGRPDREANNLCP